jgi:hypothetical protein
VDETGTTRNPRKAVKQLHKTCGTLDRTLDIKNELLNKQVNDSNIAGDCNRFDVAPGTSQQFDYLDKIMKSENKLLRSQKLCPLKDETVNAPKKSGSKITIVPITKK